MTQSNIHTDLQHFIDEWNNDSDSIIVHTSGSTGAPKPLVAKKAQMINSALLTCDFLNLKEGDSALLCMPLKYIAGKMVVVRSLVRNLNLIVVEPSGNPLKGIESDITFAAMTPMQVFNTLNNDTERKKLMNVRELIIGGGAIDDKMADILRTFPNRVWSTYGMTETLSHIAMRRINGNDASLWYTPLNNVKVSLSDLGTLSIYAPLVCDSKLTTNDIAEINDNGMFRIIGRRDNVINSGGVKIQIEEVENILKNHLSLPFVITSAPDDKFGEKVIIITEDANTTDVLNICSCYLPKLWVPKSAIHSIVPLTETNKPDRNKAKAIASQKQ